MGFKYRKRVRLFPGFTLNLSKSGMSATVGIKGFSVNMGPKGTYLNTGIPGTGIYDRVRLDKPSSKNQYVKNYNIQIPMVDEVVEVKSFQPEVMTSDDLFGLKESIVNAQKVKKELKSEVKETVKQRKKAYFLLIMTRILIFGIFIKRFKKNYETCKSNAEEANETYKNFGLDIDFEMDQSLLNEYIILKNSFERLTQCRKIWDITSAKAIDSVKNRTSAKRTITRTPIKFSIGSIDYINSKYDALKIQNANGGDLYIYPGFIVMPSKHSSDFAVIDFRDVMLMHHQTKFVESQIVPADAKIVDRTYQYVNKNGTPDRRYKYNPEIPVVLYYEVELKSKKGLFEGFHFSNVDAAEVFWVAFEKYQYSLSSMNWNQKSLETNLIT